MDIKIDTPVISDIDINVHINDTSDYFNSIQVSSDCTNSWGLASKDFVISELKKHFNSNEVHNNFFNSLITNLNDFIEVSGYGHITAIKDIYGNTLECNGFSKTFFGSLSGYIVICKTRFDNFEVYCSDIYKIFDELKTKSIDKSNPYLTGQNISINNNTISKKDTIYKLQQASSNVFGGVYLTDTSSITDEKSTLLNSKITNDLLPKQNTISTDDSIVFNNNYLTPNYGLISNNDINSTVNGEDFYKNIILKQNKISVNYPLKKSKTNISIAETNKISKDSNDIINSKVLSEALSKKQDNLNFDDNQFSNYENKISILSNINDDTKPMLSNDINQNINGLKYQLDLRTPIISSDNITLKNEVQNKKTDIKLLYGSIAENDNHIISNNQIKYEFDKKQNKLSIKDKNESGIINDNNSLSLNISSLNDYKNNEISSYSTIKSKDIFNIVNNSDNLLFDNNNKLFCPTANYNTYGIIKIESTSSTESINTIQNSNIVSELNTLNDVLSIDSNNLLSSDENNYIKLEINYADSIKANDYRVVKSDLIYNTFVSKQLSTIAEGYAHIDENYIITNDLQTNPTTASLNSNIAGLWKITNKNLYPTTDFNIIYKDYLIYSDSVYKALQNKQNKLSFNKNEFIEEQLNTFHLCSYKNTEYLNTTSWPDNIINGATINSILSTKQHNIRFEEINFYFKNNTNTLTISCFDIVSYIANWFNKYVAVSAGAVYDALQNKQLKTIFNSPILCSDTDEININTYSSSNLSEDLPITITPFISTLNKKSDLLYFDTNSFTTCSNNEIYLLSSLINEHKNNIALGSDIYNHLTTKFDNILKAGTNIQFNNNTISKTNTIGSDNNYIATSDVSGLVFLTDKIDNSNNIVKSDSIFTALSSKNNILSSNENHILIDNNNTLSLVYGEIENDENNEKPIFAYDLKHLCDHKQNIVSSNNTESLTYIESSINNAPIVIISGKGIHYVPVDGTKTKIGVVNFYDNEENIQTIITSENYCLPASAIYSAIHNLIDFTYNTNEFLISSNSNNITSISLKENSNSVYFGNQLNEKINKKQPNTFFDTNNFVITDSTNENIASSIALSCTSSFNDNTNIQLESKEIIKYCYENDIRTKTVLNEKIYKPYVKYLSSKSNNTIYCDNYSVLILPKKTAYDRDINIIKVIDSSNSSLSSNTTILIDQDKERNFIDTKIIHTRQWNFSKTINNLLFINAKNFGLCIFNENIVTQISTYNISDIIYADSKYIAICNDLSKQSLPSLIYTTSSDTSFSNWNNISNLITTNVLFKSLALDNIHNLIFTVGNDNVSTDTNNLSSIWCASVSSFNDYNKWKCVSLSNEQYNNILIHNNHIIVGSNSNTGLKYSDISELSVTLNTSDKSIKSIDNIVLNQSNITSYNSCCLIERINILYAIMSDGKIYRSDDSGKNWNVIYEHNNANKDLTNSTFLRGYCEYGAGIFVAYLLWDNYIEIVESFNACENNSSFSILYNRTYTTEQINNSYNNDIDIETYVNNDLNNQTGTSIPILLPNTISFIDNKFYFTFSYETENQENNNHGSIITKDDAIFTNFLEYQKDYIPENEIKTDKEQIILYTLHDITNSDVSIKKYILNNQNSIYDKNQLFENIIAREVENYIDNEVSELGSYVFADCTKLKKVVCKSVKKVNDYAFSNCFALSSIYLPICTDIADNSFANLKNIEQLYLPSCTSIGINSFSNSNIQKLILNSISLNINESSFSSMTGDIYFNNMSKSDILLLKNYPFGANSNVTFHDKYNNIFLI